MAISVASVVKKVRDLLGDQDETIFPDAQLLDYLNEGQRAAVLIRPEVNPVTEPMILAAGTKQSVPDDGYVFFGLTRNLGSDGTTVGRSITPTDTENLDQSTPDWHAEPVPAPASNGFRGVINYVYDSRNRSVFYIYPYAPAGWQVEIVYAKSPGDAVNEITIDNVYEPALVNYMMHRAKGKDPATPDDIQISMGYLSNFTQLITGNADQKELELVVRHSPSEGSKGGRS